VAFFLPDTVGTYPSRVAYTAAGVAFAVYLVNFIASFWLPEPNPKKLEE
jgi:hypothetical protein